MGCRPWLRAIACVFASLTAALPGCELYHVDATTDAPTDLTDAPTGSSRLVEQSVQDNGATLMLNVTLDKPATAGDLLVMVGAANAGQLHTVASGSSTWSLAVMEDVYTNVEIWYAIAVGGDTEVTLAYDGETPTSMWADVTEWSRPAPFLGAADIAQKSGSSSDPGLRMISVGSDQLTIIGISAQPTTAPIPTPMGAAWQTLEPIETDGIRQGEWYALGSAFQTQPVVAAAYDDWDGVLVSFPMAP
jgi:hypothetical protein